MTSQRQAVTYTVDVLIPRKRCKIQTLLLHTTNSDSEQRHPKILTDLQGHLPSAIYLNGTFHTVV